jgi:hypothetical protein
LKKSRLVGFVIFILIGFVVGLIYGWVINPSGVKSTTLASLRADFKADYVVMVSEIYSSNHDLESATNYLTVFKPARTPIQSVQDALLVGQQFGFSEREMRSLADLEIDLSSAAKGETP